MTSSTYTFAGHRPFDPTGHLLVTTPQRDRAVELLKDLYADERLDKFEFDRRLDTALRAKTRSDLNVAFDGVQAQRPTPAAFARPQAPVVHTDARFSGGLTHWLGYPTLFVGPLVVAATGGRTNPELRRSAVEAANFQLTFVGAMALLGFLSSQLGILGIFFPMVGFLWFVLTGVAGLATMSGSRWRYPFALRVLR